jgi:hypothetical protein
VPLVATSVYVCALPSQVTGNNKSCVPASKFAIGFPPSIDRLTFAAPVTRHWNSLIVGALQSIGFGVALNPVIVMFVLCGAAVVRGVVGVVGGAAGGAVVAGVVPAGAVVVVAVDAVVVLDGASVDDGLGAVFLAPPLHAASTSTTAMMA